MTSFYNTTENNQAQNNIKAHIFKCPDVENPSKELNYFEKRVLHLKVKCSKFKNKTGALPYILEYLELRANNDTGILIWCSQEEIAKQLGINRQTAIQCLLRAEKENLIVTRRSRGFKKINRYRVRYELYEEDPDLKKQAENMKLRKSLKPHQTSFLLDVAPATTHTTNKKEKEVSINTYEKDNTNFSNFNSKIEEEIPIKMSEEWQPTEQTERNLKKCLGVTEQFIRDEIKGFKKSVMKENNEFQDKEKSSKEWNAIFYGHCKRTLDKYHDIPPSRRIPQYRRIDHNNKPKPCLFKIANTKIEYEDMRDKSTPDDIYQTEEDLDADLAAWYARMGTTPPKLE